MFFLNRVIKLRVLDFSHTFPINIKDATITLPYVLYNDPNKNNSIEVFVKDKEKIKIS